MALKRFSVSMEEELAEDFDRFVENTGFENRSQAVSQIIGDVLARREVLDPETPAIAAVSLVFDHGKHLDHKLVKKQHKYLENVVSVLHVHISEERCMEVLVIRGTKREIRLAADELMGVRGVLMGEVIFETGA